MQPPSGGGTDGKPPPQVLELIGSAERAARALVSRLSPPVLFDMGLAPALEWLAEEMQRVYRLAVKVSFPASGEALALDETVRSVLFRSVRELLTNVAKHAGIHAAKISVTHGKDTIAVSVSDAGAGFDATLSGRAFRPGQRACADRIRGRHVYD
jgi:signal transduction histidine kinase